MRAPGGREDDGDSTNESYVTYAQDEGDLINTLDCSSRKPDAQEQVQYKDEVRGMRLDAR
jgi:hypothetical protein